MHEDRTYRERREARAERLREWADKREVKAESLQAANEPYRGDIAFNTQPSHIPERARVIRRTEKAWEHSSKAASMRSRADSIEAAAAHAIYSDDVDAIERLTEKLAGLEAERAQIKAFNAAVRKAGQVTAEARELLTAKQRADYLSVVKHSAYSLGKHGEFPSYVLSNLSGLISTTRKRLASMS